MTHIRLQCQELLLECLDLLLERIVLSDKVTILGGKLRYLMLQGLILHLEAIVVGTKGAKLLGPALAHTSGRLSVSNLPAKAGSS